MISVDSKAFVAAVKIASSVIERRSCIPVLQSVRLHANGRLAIEGTDLDTTARAEIDYQGEADDLLLGAPHRVLAALRAERSVTVMLKRTGGGEPAGRDKLRLSSGALSAELAMLPADDFPDAAPLGTADFSCTLGAGEMRQLARVMPAISTEETRYYLNGVHAHRLDEWTFRFVATDGHRLMMVDVPLPDADGELPDNFIMPRRFIERAVAIFGRIKDPLRMRVGRAVLRNEDHKTLADPPRGHPRVSLAGRAGLADVELTGKLIDGTFPDYSRVVPGAAESGARVSLAELTTAIRALTPLARSKTPAIRFVFADGGLRLELNSPDFGEGRYPLACENNCADGFSIGFNGNYLRDILRVLTGEEVQFAFLSPGDPVVITDPADTAFKAVLMPMRV